MRRVVSVALTAALVMSMGVAAFAATPSKTTAAAVEATVTATVESGTGTIKFEEPVTAEAKAEAEAQATAAVQNVAASVDLTALTGATETETVDVAAVKTVTVAANTLSDDAKISIEMDSAVLEAAYKDVEDGTEVTVLAAVPVIDPATGKQAVDENGNPVFQYHKVGAVVVKGKVQVKLTGAQVKTLTSGGNGFTLMALTKTETAKAAK